MSSELLFADDVGLFFSTGSVGIVVDVDGLVALRLNAEVHAVTEVNEQPCKTTKRIVMVRQLDSVKVICFSRKTKK